MHDALTGRNRRQRRICAARGSKLLGEHYHKPCPRTLGAWMSLLQLDATAVRLSHGPHYCKTKAKRAAAVTRAAHEALEQRPRQALRHSRSVILDDQTRFAGAARGVGNRGNANLGTGWRMAQCVLDQVEREPVHLVTRCLYDCRLRVE